MHGDHRNGSGPEEASRSGLPSGNPLDRLAAEHTLQLELCSLLEFIADGLPDRIDRRLVREVTTVLAHGLTAHFKFEEDVLFPLLRQRASADAALIAALDQLESEHGRDADLGEELAEELNAFCLKGQARNVEMLGYMLRGYFEGQRRHIEWENTIVLPAARRLLTFEDLQDLAPRLEPSSHTLTSHRNLPRARRQ